MTSPRPSLNTGQIVSGIGHAMLIFYVLFGGIFRSNPDPVQVQEVQILSEADFAALTAPSAPPEATSEIAAPPAPDASDAVPEAPDVPPAPQTPPRPRPTPEPRTETPPEPVAPTPPATIADTPPVLRPPTPEATAPDIAATPTPDSAPRVAPDPVRPPEPDTSVADEIQDSVSPDAQTDQRADVDAQEATAPEEATTEIVTEAEDPARAPATSVRPRPRPDRAAATPTPVPDTPRPETAETPPPAAPTGVEAALAEALGGGAPDPQPDLPVGPPMTGGERDALRVAVQRCWVVDVGSQAANVTVVVGMQMDRSGRVVSNSLRMIESSGGDPSAAQTAFQAARRAILRCQGDGFPLPPEKYAQWQDIEMVFDPSGMRLR
ncbi:cell envelope integrity protein TolA [Roseivivax sp. CAU 1753]